MLAAVLVIAAVAVLTADYPWVVTLRHRAAVLWGQAVATTTERAKDEATVTWIAEHRDALLVAGGILAVAVLWFADLSWFGLLVVLALIGAYALAVHRIGGPRTGPEGPAADLGPPSAPVGGVGRP